MQGMLFAGAEVAKTPVDLIRLWMHEAARVYRDKLVDGADMETYDKLIKDIVKKNFEVGLQACLFYITRYISNLLSRVRLMYLCHVLKFYCLYYMYC